MQYIHGSFFTSRDRCCHADGTISIGRWAGQGAGQGGDRRVGPWNEKKTKKRSAVRRSLAGAFSFVSFFFVFLGANSFFVSIFVIGLLFSFMNS